MLKLTHDQLATRRSWNPVMTIVKRLSAVLDAKLGRCGRCMRKAFLAALVAWVFAGAGLLAGWAWLGASLALAAAGLSALWLAHLSAFAGRATHSSRPARPDRPLLSRRTLIGEFTRAAAFAALATAISTRAALAAGCVQPPSPCSQNSDCSCSSCCGDLSGIHVCQPTC
jgi:hypothetical protein